MSTHLKEQHSVQYYADCLCITPNYLNEMVNSTLGISAKQYIRHKVMDEEGFPTIKAMLRPRKREGIRTIYLHTNTSSMRVRQYRENNCACVYFCDARFFRGVMLRGTMEVLTDSASKEMLWQEGDTMYYKEGVTDPDYCVLRFTAHSGRFYSNFGSEDFIIE